ncbi:MAG: peptidase E [Actinobacteria bacterium]|nr:MAG: peptidase E [Actinomycetota bacterium]
MAERQILGLGGGGSTEEETRRLLAHVVGLAGKSSPKVCVVPTAVGDDAGPVLRLFGQLPEDARPSYLPFFPWPPDDLRGFALDQDVIFVGGGNTANALAIWRAHGFDRILREAWESGIVLTGWSAGMICWFEAGITDSFGPQLEGMRDGLGFLGGSACPHYDGEELRRPVYTRLVAEGFPPGVAADDGVGLHYVGTGLIEAVSVREGAGAYRVVGDGEEPLPVRLLG